LEAIPPFRPNRMEVPAMILAVQHL
jgi:hypothetical protein